MPRQHSKYFWPASGLSESDMDLLFRARESSTPHVPITRLIAQAVRTTYGHLADVSIEMPQPQEERTAA